MTKPPKLEKRTKESFGYTLGSELMMYKYNPNIPKGNFIIVPRQGFYYWYFQLGIRRPQDKTRMKYICKCFDDSNEIGETSFDVCIQKLITKVGQDFSIQTNQNTKLTLLIDDFLKEIMKERLENEYRRKETTSSIINGVRQFRMWVLNKDIRLSEVLVPRQLKQIVKDYLEYISEKTSPSGKVGLSHNTKKTYLKQVRYFFEWLEDEDVGKGVLPTNSITRDFCKKILPPNTFDKSGISERNFLYESEWYDEMFNTCLKKVRDLWIEFIENGHSRPNRNQPLGVGSDIVYFISLLQIDSGFRMGELLTSYRSMEYYLGSVDRSNNNSYTYWNKKNGVWCLFMNWKGKESVVPITTKIRSWMKPKFDGVEVEEITRKNGTKFWDRSLIDVCMKMFRESPFLFSSPNRRSNKLGHYSRTQYSNNVKNMISVKGHNSLGWEGYGIFTSHDFRDYFITHKLGSGLSIEDVSSITRNSIQTIQKYYLRMDIGGQIKRQLVLDDTRKVLSNKEMKKRKENRK